MQHFQLVCILSIIAIAHAGGDAKENEAKIAKFVEECRKETNASADDVKTLDLDDFPKTKVQYCLTACYYKKSGIINADDTINIDKALDDIADLKEESKELHDKLEKILRDCNAKYTPTKDCDSIKMYFDCMQKFAKEAGISLEK
ncbi:Odorant-binding protein 19d [Carabus blaptoides fortunei]